jgi:hypothetical protein
MYTLGTIREFETRNFKVIVDAVEDIDTDLSFDKDGEVCKGLESGKYVAFCARVRVLLHGKEVGTDYLGGCIYESLDAFQDHRAVGYENELRRQDGETGRCGSYFHDMIRAAIAEARKSVADLQTVRVRVA